MNNHKKRIGKYIIYLTLKLGTGTFAEVFIGENEQTKEEVAIKVVAKVKIEEDQYTKNAFFSEIQIMKRLKSSHIIKFLDVHETKNNFYIILEKADQTLRAKLYNAADRKFQYKPTMKCLIQIMNGFGELVKHGIIHRDLKPENILFKGEILKIADFGFAKHSENNCFLNSIVGTPAYMAPQVLSKQQYTFKCDIWSLGVIVYEMLFGKNPWNIKEKNVHEFRKEVLTKKVTFPQNIEIPNSMKDFILGCLEIDEEKRFDWHKVFNHEIFGGKFIDNFKKQDTTKITFIMTNFRMNLHSKNINLNKIFSKLGKKISKSDFQNLIKFIYKEITDGDFDIIYSIVEKQNLVDIELLVELLNKYQCRMTGVDLSKRQMQNEGEETDHISKNVFALMNRLKNCIQTKNINIYKLFYGKGQAPENQVTFDKFCADISIIDDSLFQNDLSLLFTEFKGNNQIITNFYVYQIICKIAQIVPMESEEN